MARLSEDDASKSKAQKPVGAYTGCIFLFVLLFLTPLFIPKVLLPIVDFLDPGVEQEILAEVRKCPEARRALGKDIRFKWGLGCGSFSHDGPTSTSGVYLNAPIGGSKATGRLKASRSQHGGMITVNSGVLTVDGEEINLLQCRIEREQKAVQRKVRKALGRAAKSQKANTKRKGKGRKGKVRKGKRGKRR